MEMAKLQKPCEVVRQSAFNLADHLQMGFTKHMVQWALRVSPSQYNSCISDSDPGSRTYN